ncbi:zinc ribbon domain-containing protein [Deltaproteobacteria bacterium OttesenSCG-928-K17]|nr:zinc ribbon domain-containing protein [Deltaproteobacteria bacterium OttesenSCG-928-K17]
MPIYEYKCEKCGETTEVIQKFSDAPLTLCPGCGGPVAKLMSMNSFQLKGSGWYVTDYAGKNSSTCKKESSGESGPATPCAEKKAAGESGCKDCCAKAPASAASE